MTAIRGHDGGGDRERMGGEEGRKARELAGWGSGALHLVHAALDKLIDSPEAKRLGEVVEGDCSLRSCVHSTEVGHPATRSHRPLFRRRIRLGHSRLGSGRRWKQVQQGKDVLGQSRLTGGRR